LFCPESTLAHIGESPTSRHVWGGRQPLLMFVLKVVLGTSAVAELNLTGTSQSKKRRAGAPALHGYADFFSPTVH